MAEGEASEARRQGDAFESHCNNLAFAQNKIRSFWGWQSGVWFTEWYALTRYKRTPLAAGESTDCRRSRAEVPQEAATTVCV